MNDRIHYLTEITVDLIVKKLRDEFPAKCAQYAADPVFSKLVDVRPPQDYFIFEKAKGYRLPAVFVVADDVDFNLAKGANHINALAQINIGIVIENKDAERIQRQAYRYQAMLHALLAEESLVTPDDRVKIVIKVDNAKFSPIYMLDSANTAEGTFRKEVWLSCSVEHYERLN